MRLEPIAIGFGVFVIAVAIIILALLVVSAYTD